MTSLLTLRRVTAWAGALATAATAQLLLAPAALADPPLSLSATTVEPGGSVRVSGTECFDHFQMNAPFVTVGVADDYRALPLNWGLPKIDTDGNGNWSSTVSTGDLPPGDYEIRAICHGTEGWSSYYSPASITVAEPEAPAPAPAPRAPSASPPSNEESPAPAPDTSPAPAPTFAPTEGCTDCATIEGGGALRPGQHLVLSYTGFQPGEHITVVLHSTPVTLGMFIADDSGAITADVTIPADADPGQHTLTLSGPLTGDHDMTFKLAAAQKDSPTRPAVKDAGTDLTLPLALGGIGATVVIGAGATLYLRRRRATTPDNPTAGEAPQEVATPIAAPMA